MRIIAGTLKGRVLQGPTWDGVRPSSDRLRETLFNILTPRVPCLAATHARGLLDAMLVDAGLQREDLRGWILHPGGRDVLKALQESLELCESDLRHSAKVLREHGNMSSPCVLFALQNALADHSPGGWWWLSSFGAGFSCHGALLEVG